MPHISSTIVTIRDIRNRQVALACHPRAGSAWQCWRMMKRQFSVSDRFSSETLTSIQQTTPIHVLQVDKKSFQYFGGFSSVAPVCQGLTDSVTLCVYRDIEISQIERIAWMSVLQTLLFDLDRGDGLGSFYGAVNEFMPTELIREVFGRKNISRKTLGKMAGVSPESIRWQNIKQHINEESHGSGSSILDSILEVKND